MRAQSNRFSCCSPGHTPVRRRRSDGGQLALMLAKRFDCYLKLILLNVVSPVVVLASLDMGGLLLSISALSFLGLGAQAPQPEWGRMLNDARPFIQTDPHTMIFPGLAIFISVMAFNLLGDGLRDVLDPHSDHK